MKHSSRYVTGWIDTTVHDFVRELDDRMPSRTPYALITSIDSSVDLRKLLSRSPELKLIAHAVELVGNAALLPTRELIDLERRSRIFFGFDEAWFLKRHPPLPKPDEIVITAPQRFIEIPGSWLDWMDVSGCTLARLPQFAAEDFLAGSRTGVLSGGVGSSPENSM